MRTAQKQNIAINKFRDIKFDSDGNMIMDELSSVDFTLAENEFMVSQNSPTKNHKTKPAHSKKVVEKKRKAHYNLRPAQT